MARSAVDLRKWRTLSTQAPLSTAIAVLLATEPLLRAEAVALVILACHRNQEVVPRPDRAALQLVGLPEHCHRGPVTRCDVTERLACQANHQRSMARKPSRVQLAPTVSGCWTLSLSAIT